MAEPAALLGSRTSGHGCYGPTQVMSGSPDVKINGIPAARVTDMIGFHQCSHEPYDGHTSNVAVGSGTVKINGKAAAKLGSRAACSDTIIGGLSSNVRIG